MPKVQLPTTCPFNSYAYAPGTIRFTKNNINLFLLVVPSSEPVSLVVMLAVVFEHSGGSGSQVVITINQCCSKLLSYLKLEGVVTLRGILIVLDSTSGRLYFGCSQVHSALANICTIYAIVCAFVPFLFIVDQQTLHLSCNVCICNL